MSVLKSRRRQSPLNVLNDANALTDYSLNKLENPDTFPKNKRWLYATRIQDTCMEIAGKIKEANAVRVDASYGDVRVLMSKRLTLQSEAYSACGRLIEYIEQAYVHLPLSGKEADHWMGLADTVIRGLAAWRKSDLETYKGKYGDFTK